MQMFCRAAGWVYLFIYLFIVGLISKQYIFGPTWRGKLLRFTHHKMVLFIIKWFYSRTVWLPKPFYANWAGFFLFYRTFRILRIYYCFCDDLLYFYGIFYRKNNHFHNVPWLRQMKWLKPKLLFLFAGINFLCVRNAGAAPDLRGGKEAVGGFPRPSIIRNCLLLGILPGWFCSGRSEKFGITLPCLWRGVWSLCAACSCWEWLVGSVCALIALFCRNPQWNSPNPPGFMLDWSPWTPSN